MTDNVAKVQNVSHCNNANLYKCVLKLDYTTRITTDRRSTTGRVGYPYWHNEWSVRLVSKICFIGVSDQANPGLLSAPGYLLLSLTFPCVHVCSMLQQLVNTCGDAMVNQSLLDHRPCRTRQGCLWGPQRCEMGGM